MVLCDFRAFLSGVEPFQSDLSNFERLFEDVCALCVCVCVCECMCACVCVCCVLRVACCLLCARACMCVCVCTCARLACACLRMHERVRARVCACACARAHVFACVRVEQDEMTVKIPINVIGRSCTGTRTRARARAPQQSEIMRPTILSRTQLTHVLLKHCACREVFPHHTKRRSRFSCPPRRRSPQSHYLQSCSPSPP